MDAFETHRSALTGIAYRMLGSMTEAEDIVQEAYLRARASSASPDSPKAWLSKIVTRLCLDQLKSARVQRETYAGPWLPEPIRTGEPADTESISLAFMVLLESLTPTERAAYVLHEIFDYGHAEIASMLEEDEATCRQWLRRARQRIDERPPRFAPSKEQHRQMVERFISACATGDVEGLRHLLAADAVCWSDGGGQAKAARKPVRSADAVARLMVGLTRKANPEAVLEVVDLNGFPGLLLCVGGRPVTAAAIETDGNHIFSLWLMLNPEKLRHVGPVQN